MDWKRATYAHCIAYSEPQGSFEKPPGDALSRHDMHSNNTVKSWNALLEIISASDIDAFIQQFSLIWPF